MIQRQKVWEAIALIVPLTSAVMTLTIAYVSPDHRTLALAAAGLSVATPIVAVIAARIARVPRAISQRETRLIAEALNQFKGLRVVLGAIPASQPNTNLAKQILSALSDAKIDVIINHPGVAHEVDPSAMSGIRSNRGVPSGVTAFFVGGNSRAQSFSEAFAKVLNRIGITTLAEGDWRDDWVISAIRRYPDLNRQSQMFEAVTVVIGDKP